MEDPDERRGEDDVARHLDRAAHRGEPLKRMLHAEVSTGASKGRKRTYGETQCVDVTGRVEPADAYMRTRHETECERVYILMASAVRKEEKRSAQRASMREAIG